jgi:hypothetical protein
MILRGNHWIKILIVKVWANIKQIFCWKNQKLLWAAYLYWAILGLQYFLIWFLFAVYIPWDSSNELIARLIEALIYFSTSFRHFLTVLIALMAAYYLYPKNYAVSAQYCMHLALIFMYWFFSSLFIINLN